MLMILPLSIAAVLDDGFFRGFFMDINWSFTASGTFRCHSSPAFLSRRYDYLDSYYMANKSSASSYLETLVSMRRIDLIKHLLLCQMKICTNLNCATPLSTGLFARG